jgi:hypothetical protein
MSRLLFNNYFLIVCVNPRVLDFLRLWAKRYRSDLTNNQVSNLLKLLVAKCNRNTSNEFKLIFLQHHPEKNRRLSTYDLAGSPPTTPISPPSPKQKTSTMPHLNLLDNLFMDMPVPLVANELTRLEAELFVTITVRELVNQGWQAEPELNLSPNVTRIIERFNEVRYNQRTRNNSSVETN